MATPLDRQTGCLLVQFWMAGDRRTDARGGYWEWRVVRPDREEQWAVGRGDAEPPAVFEAADAAARRMEERVDQSRTPTDGAGKTASRRCAQPPNDRLPATYRPTFGAGGGRRAAEARRGLRVHRGADGRRRGRRLLHRPAERPHPLGQRRHRNWPMAGLDVPLLGDLPTPQAFAEHSRGVTPDAVKRKLRVSADLSRYLDWIARDLELGADRVYLQHVGPDMPRFIDAHGQRVLPAFA